MTELKLIYSNLNPQRTSHREKLRLIAVDGEILDYAFVKKIQALVKAKKDHQSDETSKSVKVTSSWISKISLRDNVLTIKTTTGKNYKYLNVDLKTFNQFAAAKSPGQFYLKHIADSYPRKKSA